MATAGPNITTSGVDDATVGSTAWTNPGNATSTSLFASASNASQSHFLKCTGFGFAIPSGATINGIQVTVANRRNQGTPVMNVVRLVKAGVIQSTSKSFGATPASSTTFGDQSLGSSSDLWGGTWTDSDINASNFGFAFSFAKLSKFNVGMDAQNARMTITYTAGGVTNTSSAFFNFM